MISIMTDVLLETWKFCICAWFRNVGIAVIGIAAALCLAELFEIIVLHISETPDSHLTRSDDILKHTILHVINFQATLLAL